MESTCASRVMKCSTGCADDASFRHQITYGPMSADMGGQKTGKFNACWHYSVTGGCILHV